MNPKDPQNHFNPDDTQPQNTMLVDDATHPKAPQHQRIRRWLLVVIMVTVVSLAATVALLLPYLQDEAEPRPMTVTLLQDGASSTIRTTHATVSDLLKAEGIVLTDDDALSLSPQMLLQDGMTITIGRARSVTITVDGVTRTLRTPFNNPYDVLRQANITLEDDDRVRLDGIPTAPSAILLYETAVTRIDIERPISITIIDNGTQIPRQTTARTVGDAIAEANITLQLADSVQPQAQATLSDTTMIEIVRGVPIEIEVDGTTLEARVSADTVGEALAEVGVVLGGLDYVLPTEETAITSDMTLQVIRITEDIVSAREPIPYETTYQSDETLELDQRAVVQAGQTGVRRVDERVRYANGEEIGREPAGSVVEEAPINEIVAYGTRIVLRDVQTPEGTRQYWRKFQAYATSYHPAALGGDNVTSIGETLVTGIVAANPNIIPYRTDVFVQGYGVGMMADTGGARSSPYWIDLGYSDEDWVSWSRYVDVYLLAPVPENINYLLPAWTPIRGQQP
jgi:uncharacterized protein YabE (DUF348 family)